MNPEEILVIMVPRPRRDDVVDVLMACEQLDGFTMTAAGGFSRAHAELDLREQVQGYRDVVRFEVLCSPEVRAQILERVAGLAGRDRFFYWVMPVLDRGPLGAN